MVLGKKVTIFDRNGAKIRSVPTQNLNLGFSYPLMLKLEGMKRNFRV